ncbi:GNAT family N-acetyltransferase [Streptomyces sp. NPDC021212]|uniref:GNAT family N-acetyltransferase n=1 Tax=Streptomyces sp. NPDC021212 TaxID=3365118 RepID=UPI0037A0BEDF
MLRRLFLQHASAWKTSGHLDGSHEDVVTALVREAREETCVVIDPVDVRAAVTVHHRSPGGHSRTGFFFEVRRWEGEPQIAEPEVCDAMDWVCLDALPTDMVAYCRAGLDAYAAGARLAVHFQMSGDAIAYHPDADRLRIVPNVTGQPPVSRPEAAVVEFAEQAMGLHRGPAPAATAGPPDAPGRPAVRMATPADAEGIARLRSAYVLSEPLNEEWIQRSTAELAPRLTPAGDARAFVIDAPDGSLAACALGLIHPVLPAPAYPKGLAARVHVVATHPKLRRRGCARAVVSALLHQLQAEHVTLFEFHASDEAAPLYREFGFASSPALMRMTRLEVPAVPEERHSGPTRLPPEQYAETVMKATGFACVYFTDEDDRPLQLHAVYSSTHPWQMAGGTMDPGERPWQTAIRECEEETGITLAGPPRLLATVFGLPGTEWPYSTIGCVFDGGRLTAAQIRGIALDPAEHDHLRVLPLEEWEALMPPRDFARLSAVAQARRTGVAAYFDTWDWGNE